jgi:hypothetical protein
MRSLRLKQTLVALGVAGAVALGACGEENPIDRAQEDLQQQAEDFTQGLPDEARDARDQAQDTADQIQEQIDAITNGSSGESQP